MVDYYREDLSPEIRVARLLLKRKKLRPPVPVHDVLAAHADLERTYIPSSVDGLVFRRAPGGRPRVILNSRVTNRNRERFTAAHELGHIILPWQTGTVFCHTEEAIIGGDETYRDMETEANRFAGELLVPTEWARSELESKTGELARRIINLAGLADVSPMVVGFAVVNVLKGTIVFVTRGELTLMSVFGPVLGSWGRTEWSPGMEAKYRSQGAKCSSADFGPYAIHCVEFQSSRLPKRPDVPSTDVLDEIVYRVVKSQKERVHLAASVNGIIGNANTMTSATRPEDFMVALRHRFSNRPGLDRVVGHPRFEEFLVAKSYELAERKRGV